MLLWLVLALMSAVVVAVLLHPLLARGASASARPDAGSLAVYRDQLAEVEAEHRRGLIGAEEAEAARREIARRLIASAGPDGGSGAVAAAVPPAPRRIAWGLGIGLPIAALATYLMTGAPWLPGQPLAARRDVPAVNPEMAKLITAVEARLRQQPEDGRGWDVIAPVYLKLARYGDAADAFRKALRFAGETPRRLAGLAEALMMLDSGRVGDETRSTLARLLVLEPGHPQARFWLAFAKEQDGSLAEAVADYERLLADAPADAPWRPMVEQRRAAIRAALPAPAPSAGTGRPSAPEATTPGPSAPSTPPPGPSAADIAAAERMSPAERQAMIDDMVSGLAARLEKDGRDLAGWQRLIRALVVLGRKDDASAALGRARTSFAGEPAALAALADLARSLGLDT